MSHYNTLAVKALRQLLKDAGFKWFNFLQRPLLLQFCEKFEEINAPLRITDSTAHEQDPKNFATMQAWIDEKNPDKKKQATAKGKDHSTGNAKRKREDDAETTTKKLKVAEEKNDGAAIEDSDTAGLSETHNDAGSKPKAKVSHKAASSGKVSPKSTKSSSGGKKVGAVTKKDLKSKKATKSKSMQKKKEMSTDSSPKASQKAKTGKTKSPVPRTQSAPAPDGGSPGSSDDGGSDDDGGASDPEPEDDSEASEDDDDVPRDPKTSPKTKSQPRPKPGMTGSSSTPQKTATKRELTQHKRHLGTHRIDDYTMKWDPIDERIPDSRLTWFEREQRERWRKRKACEEAGIPYEDPKQEPKKKKFDWKDKFLREGI